MQHNDKTGKIELSEHDKLWLHNRVSFALKNVLANEYGFNRHTVNPEAIKKIVGGKSREWIQQAARQHIPGELIRELVQQEVKLQVQTALREELKELMRDLVDDAVGNLRLNISVDQQHHKQNEGYGTF